jgi:hypothetical protein
MAFNYFTLWTEINSDPLGRGYSGMSNASTAANLNIANRNRNRATMSGTEVINAIRASEFNALTSASQERIWNTLHLGTLNPFGIEATIFTGVFGVSSCTINALQTLRVESISRAEEIGLGPVAEGQVVKAKAQFGGG